MTDLKSRPRYLLKLADQEFDLIGKMSLIETIEFRMNRGLAQIRDSISEMPSGDLAKLISAITSECTNPISAKEVLQILWDSIGLGGDANVLLRAQVFGFLSICTAPPELREEKAKDVGEWIGKLEKASLGESTKNSA